MENQDSSTRVVSEGSLQCEVNREVVPNDGAASVTQDRGRYFSGEDTAALLVAGKADTEDGPLFLNDVSAIKKQLLLLGIREKNIFCVAPEDRGRHRRNIDRAIEDINDLKIRHFLFYFSGHCNKDHKFLLSGDGHVNAKDWLPDRELKNCLRRLPAKKVLIILDCCFSGGTDVGVRGGGEGLEAGGEEGAVGGRLETDGIEDEVEGACGGTPVSVPRLWDLFGCPGNGYGSRSHGGNGDTGDDTNTGYLRGSGISGNVGSGSRNGGNGANGNGGSDNDQGNANHGNCLGNSCYGNADSNSCTGGRGNSNRGNGNDEYQVVQWCSSPPRELSFNDGNRNGAFTKEIVTFIDRLHRGSDVSILEMHNQVKVKIARQQQPELHPIEACDSSSDFSKMFPRFRKM